MIEIILKADDPRIGRPGNPPKINIDGQAVEPPFLNRLVLDNHHYVVLPDLPTDEYKITVESIGKRKAD